MRHPNLITAIAVSVAIFSLIELFSVRKFDSKISKPVVSKFEVVEKYKNCDVVRYNNFRDARYHYFLDCPAK